MSNRPVVNHIGHCVTDIERSRRFYTELLGFEIQRELQVPDDPAGTLLQIDGPVGLTAVYLELGGFVLELLHFDRPGNPPARDRPLTEPGLTHLSVCVDDVDATCRAAAELGGAVIEETNIGAAVLIRDPDGQIIELLPMAYRKSLATD